MHPPQLLGVDATLFVRGSVDRHVDVAPERRHRLSAWCAARLARGDFPLAQYYADVAGS
jgi:hypothetical protein